MDLQPRLWLANCNSGIVCSLKAPLYTLSVRKLACQTTRSHLPQPTDSATMSCAKLGTQSNTCTTEKVHLGRPARLALVLLTLASLAQVSAKSSGGGWFCRKRHSNRG